MFQQVLLALCVLATALLSSVQATSLSTEDNPIVTTPLGKVEGSLLKSVLEKDIYSFRGIRYAKPPIAELRFQPPAPAEPWKDIYDATKDGPMCPQPEKTFMSEDCLNLNVYTPKLPEGEENPKRPVMVYFHAGGYYSGSGASVWVGPQYLLDRDVVLVTLNYRLATLGFISTGDKLAPGNNGLKDQVMAMKWVKNNIAAFGGDPDRVTIFGYGAGGSSVTLHMVSPMSRGLFHRAIAMSGSSLGNWPVPNHQFELAQRQARMLGCPDDSSAAIINCLKTKSALEIGNTSYSFTEYASDPKFIWLPVIEPDFGQERFLTDDPVKVALDGNITKVPFMTGVTADEYAGSAFSVMRNPKLLKELSDDFERVAPIAFMYERNTTNSKAISAELRRWYIGNEPIRPSSLSALAILYADGVTGYSVKRAAKIFAKRHLNVYYYKFDYQGRYSHFYLPGTDNVPYGVVHQDDLIYIFCDETSFPKINVTFPEYPIMLKMTTLLSNVAHTGHPTPESSAVLDNVVWKPFFPGLHSSREYAKYLVIGEKISTGVDLHYTRYDTWDRVFPLPEKNRPVVDSYHHI